MRSLGGLKPNSPLCSLILSRFPNFCINNMNLVFDNTDILVIISSILRIDNSRYLKKMSYNKSGLLCLQHLFALFCGVLFSILKSY